MKKQAKVLCGAACAVALWFRLPWSPLKKTFQTDVAAEKANAPENAGVYTRADFAHLPPLLNRYLSHCGYIGMPKARWLCMVYDDVAFMQGQEEPALSIRYTQYNFSQQVSRLALVESSLYGVPFQGYDYYKDGVGGMKGVLGKLITLFDQRGAQMDRSALVTYLAESLFLPSALLSDAICFEELTGNRLQATITEHGQRVSGIFEFNEQDEMIRFSTSDRSLTTSEGTMVKMPWSAVCGDYVRTSAGICHPTIFKAVWHLPEGDFTYFDGRIKAITYDK